MLRPLLLLCSLLLMAPSGPLTAQDAAGVWIEDVLAAPQRYWNRVVIFEGQATAVQADPVGTTRGYYLLVDESGDTGIRVRSSDLPAPGRMYRVEGQIVQDPNNASSPLVQELQRSDVGRPAWLLPVIVASSLLALGLLVALVMTLVRGREAPVEPMTVSGSLFTPLPAAPPPPMPGGDPRGAGAASMVTQKFTPSGGSLADKTQVFRHLGGMLVVTSGPDLGKEVPIGTTPYLIGRRGGRKNNLDLSDSTVSRKQARILHNDATGRFSVINESETNQTAVNGSPVDAHELRDGDVISAGATAIEFRKSSHG